MRRALIFLFALLVIPLVNAQIAINSFSSNPIDVLPGNRLRLSITLENVGEKDITNVLVKIDLTEIPFAPFESSTEQVIEEINKDDKESVSFALVALPDAEPKIYKVPVEINYNETKKTSLISLEIRANAKLDVILDNSEILKLNNQGKTNVKFVNNGLAQIKFLKVTLQESPSYEILSPNSIYIGGVDVDDFESEEFTIIPKVNNPQLQFILEYRDINNNEFREDKNIQLKVYSDVEAKRLGLEEAGFNWFFALLILLVIVLFYFYRRTRRKHAS